MSAIRRLIRADGTTQDLPGPVTSAQIRELIGATTCDVVMMRHLGSPLHVMCVDDDGWDFEVVEYDRDDGTHMIEALPIRPRRPINVEATRLYRLNCIPGTEHRIAGDVVIVPDEDFAS